MRKYWIFSGFLLFLKVRALFRGTIQVGIARVILRWQDQILRGSASRKTLGTRRLTARRFRWAFVAKQTRRKRSRRGIGYLAECLWNRPKSPQKSPER